jgi:hypothetical protein
VTLEGDTNSSNRRTLEPASRRRRSALGLDFAARSGGHPLAVSRRSVMVPVLVTRVPVDPVAVMV